MKRKVFAVGFVVVMLVALLYSTVYAGSTVVYLNKGQSSATSSPINGTSTANFWLNVSSQSATSVTAIAEYSNGSGWSRGGSAQLSPGNSAGGQRASGANSSALWRLRLVPVSGTNGVASGTIASNASK
jgi:hypothetical protein